MKPVLFFLALCVWPVPPIIAAPPPLPQVTPRKIKSKSASGGRDSPLWRAARGEEHPTHHPPHGCEFVQGQGPGASALATCARSTALWAAAAALIASLDLPPPPKAKAPKGKVGG